MTGYARCAGQHRICLKKPHDAAFLHPAHHEHGELDGETVFLCTAVVSYRSCAVFFKQSTIVILLSMPYPFYSTDELIT